ncbi:LPXTG cell wall anchor domain-containing protein [Streptococcus halichoeri]|uniref:LPXTG cell wall anchor domain-containing protein n=1 Tax=Streptococcus halichoeri TaxID=254785 RepID=UPI00135CAFB5|nr:LPXTG cell wall anchor domain-containing protein [Streptococcus halichoeri]
MNHKTLTLMNIMAVSTLGLALAGRPSPVKAHELTPSALTSPSKQGFSYTATVLAQDGKTLSGRQVTLTDITNGAGGRQISVTTNTNGQATFTNLELARNYSVTVDGINQGYTVRTDQAGAQLQASFYATAKNGEAAPSYSKTPLTVTVYNEEGEAVPGQSVTLKNKLGQVVKTLTSDQNGKAVFSEGLLEGSFYDITVNNLAYVAHAMPGEDRSYYLKSEEIKPAPTPQNKNQAADKTATDTSHHNQAATDKELPQPPKDNAKNTNKAANQSANKQTPTEPATNILAADTHAKSKTSLPGTGDHNTSLLAWLGAISLAVLGLGLVATKRVKK